MQTLKRQGQLKDDIAILHDEKMEIDPKELAS